MKKCASVSVQVTAKHLALASSWKFGAVGFAGTAPLTPLNKPKHSPTVFTFFSLKMEFGMAASLILWCSDTYWCKAQELQVGSVVHNHAELNSDSNSLLAVVTHPDFVVNS